MGTGEAGAESRRLPQCQQEVERLWAKENHGINGIWAKSRQTVPGCYSELLPEQSGTDKERKSQPDLEFNPDFLVKWLKMFSSWGLQGTEAIREQDTCERPSSLAGKPHHGHQEENNSMGWVCAPNSSQQSQRCWKQDVHVPSLVVRQLRWGKLPVHLGNTSRREGRRKQEFP